MIEPLSAYIPLIIILAQAAEPDSYSIDELEQIETARLQTEMEISELEQAKHITSLNSEELEERLIRAALESQRREKQANLTEEKIDDLQSESDAAIQALLKDKAAMEDLLAALITWSHRQPPALAVSPKNTGDAILAAILMGETAPVLSNRASVLAEKIKHLQGLRADIEREKNRLDKTETQLQKQREEISKLAIAKRKRHESITSELDIMQARLTELTHKANTLKALLQALEDTAPSLPGSKPYSPHRENSILPPTPKPETQKISTKRPIKLLRPVTGRISAYFGQKLQGEIWNKGIKITTRELAQVVAPANGYIEYAGQYRSYGRIIILDTQKGYHVILSGLDTIYSMSGQNIRQGEPIGQMSPQRNPKPELYIELWHDGKTIDPTNFFIKNS